jgi:hypothetical protein
MTIALAASTFRSGSTPWITIAPALGCVACGVAILIWPDTPFLVRMLGAAAGGISLVAAITARRATPAETAPPRLPVRASDATNKDISADAADTGPQPAMPGGAVPGTARDGNVPSRVEIRSAGVAV